MIDATAACLAEKGVAGTSVRSICMRAGVSSGLLSHYFDGVDALIAETYRATSAQLSETVNAAAPAAGKDKRTRPKIGRESGGERVCNDWQSSVDDVSFKKTKQ